MIRKDALDIDMMVRALNAISDGVAIYDAELRPVFANEVTILRFGSMHADLVSGMSYRESQLRAFQWAGNRSACNLLPIAAGFLIAHQEILVVDARQVKVKFASI